MELSFILNVTAEQEVYFEIDNQMVDEIKGLIKCGEIKCDEDIYDYLHRNEELTAEYGSVEGICSGDFIYSDQEFFKQFSS
jgi:hypothetical protein